MIDWSTIDKPSKCPTVTAKTILQQLQNGIGISFSRILDPITRFAENFPALSGNILEMHFARYAHSIDFAIRVNKQFDQGIAFSPNGYRFPLNVLPTELFNNAVENVWFEYDAPFKNKPSVFFDIGRNKDFCPEKAYSYFRDILFKYGLPEKKIFNFLQKIKEQDARVVYYGLMFSRPSSSVRLTINDIKPKNLVQVLFKLGWKGNYNAIERICNRYTNEAQKIVIAVDVEDKLRNRIGIEIFDNDSPRLIKQFYTDDLINYQQICWLKDWERIIDLPSHLCYSLSKQYRRNIKQLHTRINHFKFVVNETENVLLKGYLYYCF